MKVRIFLKFDSKKDLEVTKLELRPQILVKLSFRFKVIWFGYF